jgi:hypothetical protein
LLVATLALTLILLALMWQRLAFASAEQRPALLEDGECKSRQAHWLSDSRFGTGSSEADLLRWLTANQFEIDQKTHRAGRMVRGMPCEEKVAVTWAAANGIISASSAVISEAGCL